MIVFLCIVSALLVLGLLGSKSDKERLCFTICFGLALAAVIVYRALDLWG